jgi:hypothetical protein
VNPHQVSYSFNPKTNSALVSRPKKTRLLLRIGPQNPRKSSPSRATSSN